MKKAVTAAALFLSVCVPAVTRADIVINAVETGGDVVFSFSGSIETDVLGADFDHPSGIPAFSASTGEISFGLNTPGVEWFGWGPLPPFGTGSHLANSTAGAVFGLVDDFLFMPFGYISGADISGSMTFLSETFATLGLNPGTYSVDVGNDTITLIIGQAQVPEPATLALLGIGLAGLGFSRRKRAA